MNNSVLLGGANRANEESGAVETNLNSSLLEAEQRSSRRAKYNSMQFQGLELPKSSPKLLKTCIWLNLSALIPAIVVLVVWLMTDEFDPSPTSRTFQVFLDTESQYTDWDVCSLYFYSDNICTVAIAPQGTGHNSANIPVPTSMFDGRNGSCSTQVRLFNTTSPTDKDYWIGFTFDHPTTVKCVQMQSPLDDNYAQRSTLKYLSGSKWAVFDTTDGYNPLTLYFSPPPTQTTLWIVLLVVWIVFASLVGVFLITTPCVFAVAKWQDRQIRLLEEGAAKGSVVAWKCEEYQWEKFVVAEFGGKGRQRKPHRLWIYLLAGLAIGPGLMLVIKLRSLLEGAVGGQSGMSWQESGEIFIPIGFGLTVLVGLVVNIGIWVRFRKLRHKPQVAVLGTDSLHFITFYSVAMSFSNEMAVGKRAWLFEKSVLIRFPDEGTLLVISGKRLVKVTLSGPKYRKQTIRIPVPDTMVDHLRTALRATPIYKFNSTVAP